MNLRSTDQPNQNDSEALQTPYQEKQIEMIEMSIDKQAEISD